MTVVLERAPARDESEPARPIGGTDAPARPSRRTRLVGALRTHRTSILWVVPLLAITAAARLVNLGGTPQRIDDEGTYVAQAYAVERFGELAHYTYWYDHPPLGWIQIAGYTWLTGGFDRYEVAVLAGREAMVVAAVVSAGLLWLLGRRLGLGRPAAAVAVLLFALSPLAVQFTKTVYLDNVATPWVLAAFVLALTRRNQLLAFAGAATCFAIAVLTKETTLLLLPFLVWQLLRSAHPSTRRYTLSVSAALLTLMGVAYLVFALVKGELTPGEDRVSLWEGIAFQLFTRDSSGSVFDGSTQAGLTASTWLTLDAALLVGGSIAAVVGLAVRRLRPYAAAYLLMLAVMFRPGYLPVPFVIAMLPFAALLVAGVIEAGLRRFDRSGARLSRANGLAGTAAVAGLVGLVAIASLWPGQLRGLWNSDLDEPLRDAQSWAIANLDDDDRILVDDAVWVDLVAGGLPREQVVWYYKADTDADVSDLTPNGWQDYDYVLVTEGMRQGAGTAPTVDQARENSVRVASFGEGDETVELLRVLPDGTDAFYASDYGDGLARGAAGAALTDNASLSFAGETAGQLIDGQVDARVVTLLAQLSGEHEIGVAAFPQVDGEQTGELPRRTLEISSVDGEPVTGDAATELLEGIREQTGVYTPQTAGLDGDRLVVRYEVAGPENLLPAVQE